MQVPIMKRLIVVLSIAVIGFVARTAFAQNTPAGVHVRGYSIVLLLGDTQGSSMPDALSAPALARDGLFLVGLDIVAGRLLEANVFSPGGLRGAERLTGAHALPAGSGVARAAVNWFVRRSPIIFARSAVCPG